MKNFILVLAIIVQSVLLLSQAPQGFNYQAILRNTDGTVKANEAVALQISIVDEMGTSAYLEVHNVTTNEFGLVNLVIGKGASSDKLSSIDWSSGPYFIEVTVNGEKMGISQLNSVPYAMHSVYADSVWESDPVFSAWNKSSGISINESQISDLGDYIETETQSLSDVAAINNSVNSQLKDVSYPTEDNDAATKSYVDQLERRVFDLEFAMGKDTISDFDGNYYKVVKIGEQYWMAENLKTTRYADGTPIPFIEDPISWFEMTDYDKAYCWYDNDFANSKVYGAIYNWAGAMNGASTSYSNPSGVQGACPMGWHLPSDAEWKELERSLGMSESDLDKSWVIVGEITRPEIRGTDEGDRLKEVGTEHWNSPNSGATNSIGFTAVPGGRRANFGEFQFIGERCSFWTTSGWEDNILYAYCRNLSISYSTIFRFREKKDCGISVRCVKD